MTELSVADLVTIEPMRRRNIRAVRAIDRQVYPTPWSAALYLDELRRPTNRVYRVARRGPRVIGYGGAMIVHDEGHITSVAVDPAAQGGGVAARLLAAVHRGALAKGATAMTLEVRASNRRAQELYRRFGYVPAGARKDYYTDGRGEREDAIVMWCHDVLDVEHQQLLDAVEARYDDTTDWGRP